MCETFLQGISAAVALNNERTVFRACQCSYLVLLTCDYECHMDTQICLLTTLLYLDMWAMVMLAPAPRPPPCRVTSCSPPHILSHTQTQCVYNIYRSARSVRPDQLVLAQSQALAQILPTQLHNLNVCVCVCAPCVCSVNRPVPSLLSCLGGFVSCHAHVTRPSSRAKPSHQVAKCPSGNSFFMFLFLFFLFFLHCLCCAA